jgi:HemK-like putative methylase
MITLLKDSAKQTELPLDSAPQKLVDVGTGSGCLGITAKLEMPELDVTLLDTSRHALTVAESNAKRLGAAVTVFRSNLLQNYPYKADYILANLPYVGEYWDVSPETSFEPKEALYADDNGLALICSLLEQAPGHLASGGLLFIEADLRQHNEIKRRAGNTGFELQASRGLILAFQLR